MEWGTFTFTHIISLIIAILLNVIIYYIIKNKTTKTKIVFLFIISLSGIMAIIYNLVSWNSALEYLPLHLCSLNALILPITIISRNKTLGNLLLFWSLGAAFALIVNYDINTVNIFSLTFVMYYFPHVFEFGIPLILFETKIIKKESKCIFSTILITIFMYTIVHNINIIINEYCIKNDIRNHYGDIIKVNYMFSLYPSNPLLNIMYEIIPFSYWYMYLIIPIIFIYLMIIYKINIFKIKCTSFD